MFVTKSISALMTFFKFGKNEIPTLTCFAHIHTQTLCMKKIVITKIVFTKLKSHLLNSYMAGANYI